MLLLALAGPTCTPSLVEQQGAVNLVQQLRKQSLNPELLPTWNTSQPEALCTWDGVYCQNCSVVELYVLPQVCFSVPQRLLASLQAFCEG